MSSFYCEHCGAEILDSPTGYTTWCEHYPLEVPSTPMNALDELMVTTLAGEYDWDPDEFPSEDDGNE